MDSLALIILDVIYSQQLLSALAIKEACWLSTLKLHVVCGISYASGWDGRLLDISL